MRSILSILELIVALLLGAPVRLRNGRILHIRYPQKRKSVLTPSLFGFDFSKWQGVINFAQVFFYGAKFIVLRCSYAITRDERFLEYIGECLKYFPNVTSVYHYYDPTVSPTRQADKVIEILAAYKGQIKRVWGDFEFYWTGPYESPANWKIFAERIISAGYEFGVYTRATWWDSRVGVLASWFGQFPIWAAQYAFALTLIPKGWTKADIWQSGTPAIGKEVGTTSLEVDYDIMDDQFYLKEFGLPTGEPPMTMTIWKKATGSITMRTSPAKLTNNYAMLDGKAQYVLFDDVIEFSEITLGWGKIVRIFRNDAEIAIPPAPVWCGMLYTVDTDERPASPPPPTPEPPPATEKIVTVNINFTGYKPVTMSTKMEPE